MDRRPPEAEEQCTKDKPIPTEMSVYRIFTQERGIPLSKHVIKHIQKTLPAESIEVYADMIKESYETGILTEKEIDSAVKNKIKEKQRIEANPVEYRPEGIERYKMLKEKVVTQKTSIVALKPDQKATIFGMARAREDGALEIEDEDESVHVSRIEQKEYFITRGVCAGFEGRLEKDGFVVENIHLPVMEKQTHQAKTNFIVISQFTGTIENILKLNNIIKVYIEHEIEISAVVIMLSSAETVVNAQLKLEGTFSKYYKTVEFIIIPGMGNRHFYPHGESRSHRNIRITTNPSEIKIENSVFLVGGFDLIDGIKEESIIKGCFRTELGKVFLSQASYNPFITYTDLSYTKVYTGIIIGDKYDCFTYKEENRMFSICGDFEKSEGQFLFYNGDENAFEVCSASGMAPEEAKAKE